MQGFIAWGGIGGITLIRPKNTLPETNSEFAPENGWLEDDRFLLGQKAHFQVQTLIF